MTLAKIKAGIPARIQAGIEWLDENEFGWRSRIDEESLNMQINCKCIGGQLSDDFDVFEDLHNLSHKKAISLGFVAESISDGVMNPNVAKEYGLLTDAWKAALAAS